MQSGRDWAADWEGSRLREGPSQATGRGGQA